MERPKNSKIRHGMASCARYGCTRPECRGASNRTRRLSEADRAHDAPAGIPAGEAQAHAKKLTEAGMFVTDVGRLAGVSRSTVAQVISGQAVRIHRDTSAAILGVPIPDGDFTGCNGIVSALSAQRRIQGLSTRGFSLHVMAREIGTSDFTVETIRNGKRAHIRKGMDQAIRATHDRLWDADPLNFGMTPRGVADVLKWAALQGWAPPAAWDDETIGDPGATPRGLRRQQLEAIRE